MSCNLGHDKYPLYFKPVVMQWTFNSYARKSVVFMCAIKFFSVLSGNVDLYI